MRIRGRLVHCIAAVLLAVFLLPHIPQTEALAQEQRALRGVALVIGQSKYWHLAPLPNPANDADAIEALLSDLGFDSVRRADRDAATLTRDLERFAEDAAQADVAVLYYSGHGIEAGGENFLIPVDADLSALDNAGKKLVPVAALIEKLKATVPVAIVMLDACRDNPFPPGSELRLSAGSEPIAVGGAGLGLSRGAASLKATAQQAAAADTNVGTVIAFAAEPGKVALDGDAGANSPYAAAILRHFDAMAGEEFSTVMRMVAEEVYLKTAGEQRPWVNESLRRLLYFGEAPDLLAGDEGTILKERRQLLVTIAALPDAERAQVERAARNDQIPMDALYAMLRALGHDAPQDPQQLEALLRAQTGKLKAAIADRTALSSSDPEIVRLSNLADRALAEGALSTGIELLERAKSRAREISASLSSSEAEAHKTLADAALRRRELAEVFARSATTNEVSFRHREAAEDFGEAFRQVETTDPHLAVGYKLGEAEALVQDSFSSNDAASDERAMASFHLALRMAERLSDRRTTAEVQNGYANALFLLNGGDPEKLAAAIDAALRAATYFDSQGQADERLRVRNNLGTMQAARGRLEGSVAELDRAAATLRDALASGSSPGLAFERAQVLNNLGNLLRDKWSLTGAAADLDDAIASFRAALAFEDLNRDRYERAKIENNLGLALQSAAEERSNAALFVQSIEAFERALAVRTRDATPRQWAFTTNNLGYSQTLLGQLKADIASIDQALSGLGKAREALQEIGDQQGLAPVEDSLCLAYFARHEITRDYGLLRTARSHCLAAIEIFESGGDKAQSGSTAERLRRIDAAAAKGG